jgi:hypothetical protein
VGREIKKYPEFLHAQVIRAYLIDSLSHRKIQEEILKVEAPVRGGGFIAMEILHYYGISGNKKGVLKTNSYREEISVASGKYKEALEIIQRHCGLK